MSSPTVIGERYEVLRELGQGGFGTTYAARDRETNHEVAVKVLDLRRVDDWKAVELFEREAAVLKTLDHPGIPAYVEFRPLEVDKQAFLVQELAPGENLEQLLAKRRFTERDLIDLTDRVLEILAYLTSIHPIVVHRDIKPGNILLAPDGQVSVVDFGAVRAAAETALGGGSTVAGTFGYMAPEQLQGLATPSSDLYGLGMTLVHLATGREPSELETKRLKPMFEEHAELSEELEEFIGRLIEPVPDDRFASASEALAALRTLGAKVPQKRRDVTPMPSSDEIAGLRARAEREARARPRSEPPSAPRIADRVSLLEDAEGATLAIRPAPGWRGREAWLGLLSVPAFIALIAVPANVGFAGFAITLAAIGALVALILATASTLHLRVTRGGDFVFYTRNPRRPRWVGRATELELRTVPTSLGTRLATLRHVPTERGVTMHPISRADLALIKAMAKRGRFQEQTVN